MLGDFCDGSQFKAHPLFSTNPLALQIHLYYDDMEVCNPLGSNTKTHKLGLCIFKQNHVLDKVIMFCRIILLYLG